MPTRQQGRDIDRNNADRAEMDWVRDGIARGRKSGGSVQTLQRERPGFTFGFGLSGVEL